jgi:alkylation response protein AidB-like acyl-CoA dehydrogenase
MGLAIAQAMDAGHAPVQQAALLKYLGTAFERDIVDFARDALAISPDPSGGGIEALLAESITASPGATLRGGATEVLLGIVAKQELAASQRAIGASALAEVGGDALHGLERAVDSEPGRVWKLAVELGWTGIGTPEDSGGSGGDLADLADLAGLLAASAHSAPVTDSALAARIRTRANFADAGHITALALGSGVRAEATDGQLTLTGSATRVPWARAAGSVIVAALGATGEILVEVVLPAGGVIIRPGRNLAGEPRDTITFDRVRVAQQAVLGAGAEADRARGEAVLLRAAALAGALRAAVAVAREHVLVRRQFGRPLAAFQAVAHHLARMAAERAAAEIAVQQAVQEAQTCGPGWRTAAAAVVAAHAAGDVATAAHQVLGAMGITREHELHLFTLRLWSWRDEMLAEKTLAERLGEAVITGGHETTWSWIVQETDTLTAISPWSHA